MTTKRKLIIAAAAAALATGALAFGYQCQIDKAGLYFTGQTRVEQGKLLKLYKCPQGHAYWIV